MVTRIITFFSAVLILSGGLSTFVSNTQAAAVISIGVAKVDVTPEYPIRLQGYLRGMPSEGVEQKLWAKALALGKDSDHPALLITLDNCGIAEGTYKELVQRRQKSAH